MGGSSPMAGEEWREAGGLVPPAMGEPPSINLDETHRSKTTTCKKEKTLRAGSSRGWVGGGQTSYCTRHPAGVGGGTEKTTEKGALIPFVVLIKIAVRERGEVALRLATSRHPLTPAPPPPVPHPHRRVMAEALATTMIGMSRTPFGSGCQVSVAPLHGFP